MASTTNWFTIMKWLTPTIMFLVLTVAAGDSEDWTEKQLVAFSNEVLESINALRKSLNTKLLKLDPDKSNKGLNGLANLYATAWRGAPGPMPLEPDLSWVKVVSEMSGRKFEELEKLFPGALLYFDSSKNHQTGSALVKLAETRAIAKPAEADFANDGDIKSDSSYTCNTLRKLLWEPAEMIGVSAAWSKEYAKQSYVIIFDDPLAKKKSIAKLSKEAVAHLGSLGCLHFATDDIYTSAEHTALQKEIFEDEEKVKGAWTEAQATTFRKEVVLGINALRKKLGGKELTLDDDLTKAAGIYAKDFAMLRKELELKRTTPWVQATIEQTKMKDLEHIQTIGSNAILFQHAAGTNGAHLKPDVFVRLLKDPNPVSSLIGESIPHSFSNEGTDKADREGKLQVYCHRLKRMLWIPSEKVGIGMFFVSPYANMFFVVLFDSARKRFEKDTGKFTPKAVAFMQAKGNDCRMDTVGDHDEQFRKDVFNEINDLRAAFGKAFGAMKPLAEKPELMKQASNVAKAWARGEQPIDTSALPKGFILYAKRRVDANGVKASKKEEDIIPQWDASGLIQGYKMETIPKAFIKHLLDADRFGLPLPITKQSPKLASLTAATPTSARLSQLLCPEATEFGFAAWTYVYEANPYGPDLTHYFVLLFNAQCTTLPPVTDQEVIAELLRNGWVSGKGTMWWFMDDIKKLHELEEKKMKL